MIRGAGGIARLTKWFTVMAGAGLAVTGPASAKTVAPEAAPAAWLRYAEMTTVSVTQWLQADSEAATRLRAHLDAGRATADGSAAPLLLKLWIDRRGVITRVDHDALGDAAADADLKTVIVGQALAAEPPRKMLLPLRVAVTLDTAAPQD